MKIQLPHLTPPDPQFQKAEKLFHALQEDHVRGNKVLAGGIRLSSNSLSCNREKYTSSPYDVLSVKQPEDNYTRVGYLEADDLPPKSSADEKVFWEFVIEHVPLIDNYSHTEVRAKRVGIDFNEKVAINHALKGRMREALAGKMQLLPKQ